MIFLQLPLKLLSTVNDSWRCQLVKEDSFISPISKVQCADTCTCFCFLDKKKKAAVRCKTTTVGVKVFRKDVNAFHYDSDCTAEPKKSQ